MTSSYKIGALLVATHKKPGSYLVSMSFEVAFYFHHQSHSLRRACCLRLEFSGRKEPYRRGQNGFLPGLHCFSGVRRSLSKSPRMKATSAGTTPQNRLVLSIWSKSDGMRVCMSFGPAPELTSRTTP